MVGKLLYRNFILVHRLSHWLRLRFTPAGSLIFYGLVAAAVFGIDTRQTLAYQIFTLCAGLLAVALLALPFLRGRITLQRTLPDYATVGQKCEYRLTITNQGTTMRRNLLLFDELETVYPAYQEFRRMHDSGDRYRNIVDRLIGYPRLVSAIHKLRGASVPPVAVEILPGAGSLQQTVSLRPLRRGYLYFHHTRVTATEPLGLCRRVARQPLTGALLVLPRRYRLPPLFPPGQRKYQLGGMHLASSVGDSQEFFSLRDYRPGDPLRAIHWRSYAKKGEPVVKEYQDEYFSRQGLILDTFLEHRDELLLEEAVSVAASLAAGPRHQDALLDLIFIGDRSYHYTGGRGLAGTENLLEILACVQPCASAPFPALTGEVLRYVPNSSALVCVLLDWDESRRDLVRKLRCLQVPVQVIVIAGEHKISRVPDDPMRDLPHHFWVLQAGGIQQSIDRMAPHTQ